MQLAIRADASARIGAGHVMRCLALAEAWRRAGGETTLFTACPTPLVTAAAARRGVALRSAPTPDAAWRAVAAWAGANAGAWVAIDSYESDAAIERAIRATGVRLLVVDDCSADRPIDCDLLLNQNIGADALGYQVPAGHCCFGPAFALIRDEFRRHEGARRFEAPASRIVVTFGGADVHDQAGRLARVLAGSTPPLDAAIVAAQARRADAAETTASAGVLIRWQTATDTIASVLTGADLVVCAAGSTCWELAHLGIPAITLVVADNQRRLASGLDAAGVVRSLGWFEAVTDSGIAAAIEALRRDGAARAEMSRRGRALVDGRGADRVVEAMRLAAVGA
jgi:UDP-2,4-diacetamido-2,4,6-trideoxy-beta-L-altropyranose hydrolase